MRESGPEPDIGGVGQADLTDTRRRRMMRGAVFVVAGALACLSGEPSPDVWSGCATAISWWPMPGTGDFLRIDAETGAIETLSSR